MVLVVIYVTPSSTYVQMYLKLFFRSYYLQLLIKLTINIIFFELNISYHTNYPRSCTQSDGWFCYFVCMIWVTLCSLLCMSLFYVWRLSLNYILLITVLSWFLWLFFNHLLVMGMIWKIQCYDIFLSYTQI